jgi:predicted dehydrogenase
MKTIKAALVGYGMFGADVVIGSLWDVQRNGIAPYLDRLGLDDWTERYQGATFELVAVGTRSESSARRAEAEMQAATGRPLRGYAGETPWLDILHDFPDLDVLIVATPDHLHTAPILAALERGVHVITEKPLCLDLTEADQIIGLARRKDRIVAVDMHKRYDPDHLRIFDELRDSLGTPLYARGVLEEPLEVSTSTFKWAAQSDPFSYVGIHWVDLFMHYLDLTPLALYGVGQKRRLKEEHGIDAFDSTQVMVTHTSGMTIVYENNWLTPADFEGPVNQDSQLVGTRGKVESDSQYRGLRYWTENGGSRTANTHFFRKVRRPDGSLASLGYGKDSLVLGLEKVFRCALGFASANDLAGTYPDAASLRRPTAVVHAARAVIARNAELFAAGQAPVATASFTADAITLHDQSTPNAVLYQRRPSAADR